eukprot:7377189-Prymnesium_polylepis.2
MHPVRIGRRVGEADIARHTFKLHALDERVEQLAAHYVCLVLDLDQVVQGVRDCEYRVVAKCIIRTVLRQLVTSASQWCAAIVIVVLGPQAAAAAGRHSLGSVPIPAAYRSASWQKCPGARAAAAKGPTQASHHSATSLHLRTRLPQTTDSPLHRRPARGPSA